MSREELLKLIREEAERAATVLRALDPGTKEYDQAVGSLRNLLFAEADYQRAIAELGREREPEPEPAQEAKPTKEPEAAPAPAPEAEPAPAYTLEEVRAKLIEAQETKGVDVGAIISELGYRNLSKVPPERYPEIMSKLE